MRLSLLNAAFAFFLLVIFPFAWARESTIRVCFGNTCVQAEVAASPIERQKGLMFRRPLADNQGMLFIFREEALHAFWMKNMRFPLDIIWINSDKRVVDIKTNLVPCRFGPCPNIIPVSLSKYALEVRAGFVEKNKVKIGDQAVF